MTFQAYTGQAAPPQSATLVIRPEITAWTARLWQIGTTGESVPMLKLTARVDPRRQDSRAVQDGLRPFEAQLRAFAIYLEHSGADAGAAWSVGTFAIDQRGASAFLYKLLDHRIGPVVAALLGASTARCELALGVVPVVVAPSQVRLLVTDYDIGVSGRLG